MFLSRNFRELHVYLSRFPKLSQKKMLLSRTWKTTFARVSNITCTAFAIKTPYKDLFRSTTKSIDILIFVSVYITAIRLNISNINTSWHQYMIRPKYQYTVDQYSKSSVCQFFNLAVYEYQFSRYIDISISICQYLNIPINQIYIPGKP